MKPNLRSLFPRGSNSFFKANENGYSFPKVPDDFFKASENGNPSQWKSKSFGKQDSSLGATRYLYTPLGEIVKIAFRGDPASKQRPRVVNRRAFTPKETKVAEKSLKLLLVLQYPKIEPDGEHCFEVTLRFFCLGRQRKDLDNMTKLVLDACTGLVWVDDSQVTALDARVQRGSDHPRTELSIIAVESDIPFITCPCGKKVRIYRSTEETRKFCSRACSAKAQENPSILCEECGKLFRPVYKEQRFCSQICFGKFERGKPKQRKKIRNLVEQYGRNNLEG